MPRYVLQLQFNEDEPDPADVVGIDVPGEAAAKAMAEDLFKTFPTFASAGSIAIARGDPGEDLEWTGAYDWVRGSPPIWSPND